MKNRGERSTCMVKTRLMTNPIEELETWKNVIVVGAVMENTEDEGCGDGEVEGGERSGEIVVGREDLVDSEKERIVVMVMGLEPGFEGGSDVVLGNGE